MPPALVLDYVPEDRLSQGLVMNQSVGKNVVVTTLDQLVNRFRLLDHARVDKSIQRWVKDLAIKVSSAELPVQTLSGGNQQRVVLAKWIATHPKVLILDGPTIGIDVAAKFAIHEIIRDLADKGLAIILISEEISEVYHNCNHVLVMRKGCIVGDFDTGIASQDDIQNFVDRTL